MKFWKWFWETMKEAPWYFWFYLGLLCGTVVCRICLG
nr:MAG TPA: translation initiation factor-like protein [Caudoviricetes sp.]